MTARRALGDFGERVARHHLEARGLTVEAANVRVASGEIDLVAQDPAAAELVFVEVRTRRAALGAAGESITPAKLRRMWRCAMEYCDLHGLAPETARLDLVTLDLDAAGVLVAVDHIRALELPDE